MLVSSYIFTSRSLFSGFCNMIYLCSSDIT
uniref:Uncharacterized protein n=1 Tax=Anguilla anguilla TaxID=7936 RepID=A0A0E9QS73_ANGAN